MLQVAIRRGTAVLVIGTALACAPVHAEVRFSDRLPDVLKDIPPAGTMCTADDALLPSEPTGEPLPPDVSCGVDVAGLPADALFIDTRLPAEFRQFHVDGAMNMSAAELATKSFLRDRALVLVGSGRLQRGAFVDCAGLRRAGHAGVRVLRGGMQAWLTAGKPVHGVPPVPSSLAVISAEELLHESGLEQNLLLLAPSAKAYAADFPSARRLANLSVVALRGALQASRKAGHPEPPAIVLLAATPVDDGKLREWMRELAPVPLLVHTGTHDAWLEFRKRNVAMNDARVRGPARPRCGN